MKIVLIGSSGHSFTAINAIRNNRQELQLCGISSAVPGDIAPDRKCLLTQEFNCAFHADYRDMLDKIQPDIACVDSRFDQNGPVSVECLHRGIHCYTEKTIAHSFVILDQIKTAAADGDATIIGMHTMRYDPQFYAAWQAVQSGIIGTPRLIIGRKSYKFGNGRPDFYRDRQLYGGTILWVGIHALDLAWWFGGPLTINSAMHSCADNFGYGDCESHAVVTFAGECGSLGTITADFYQPSKAEEHGDDQLRIAGAKGVVEVLHGKAFLTTQEEGKIELPQEPAGSIFADYCLALQGKGSCRLTMADTFGVTAAGLKAREIADSNRVN